MSALHHLALGARDPEALAAFYRDVLGFAELKRHFDGDELRSVWLDLGGPILMIERIPADAPARSGDKMQPGLFLLAVRIAEEDRLQWIAKLQRSGALIEDETSFTSYARDPEGNRVAVSFYAI